MSQETAALGGAIRRSRRRRRIRRACLGALAIAAVAAASVFWLNRSEQEPEASTSASQSRSEGRAPGSSTEHAGLTVTSEAYGAAWPLTVDEAVLRCDEAAVTLDAEGTTYALNAAAQERHLGVALKPIWAPNPDVDGARMNIGQLIQHGLRLCE